MKGLAFIKKYIPKEATVTTCDGSTYNPLGIAQDIAKGFIDAGNNDHRSFEWPGSPSCCVTGIHLNSHEGGDMRAVYAGMQYMYNYINDDDEADLHVNGKDRGYYGLIPSFQLKHNSNGLFFLETITAGMDVGSYGSAYARGRIIDAYSTQHVEIYAMMNNLLFPAQPNIPIDRSFFEEMLCSAPCQGPCVKPADYDGYQEALGFPEFTCANVPDWTGRRWETKWRHENEDHGSFNSEIFNGLDFMALHNIYML